MAAMRNFEIMSGIKTKEVSVMCRRLRSSVNVETLFDVRSAPLWFVCVKVPQKASLL